MRVGLRLGLVAWVIGVCLSGCDLPCNCPPVNDNPTTTTEVLRFADQTAPTPKSVSVYVEHGDVSVIVVDPVDANHVVVVAPAIGASDDLTADVKFNQDDAHELITVTHKATSNPLAPTHIYIPPNVPIEIRADQGDIHIAGNVGKVLAESKNGSIDVRGPVPGLNLKVGGVGHGILVDGAHEHLILDAQAGPIEITAEQVTVDASTGGDTTYQNSPIVFIGSLKPNTNGYFTTTSASDITLVLPRNETFDIAAKTTGQSTIDVQFPGPPTGEGIPVCGTFDSGDPYVYRVDDSGDSQHKDRAQVIFNRGGQPFTGTLQLIGRLTADNFAFHSSVRTFYALMPQVEQLYIDTCGGALPAPPTQSQTTSTTGTLTPEQQKIVDSFTGGAAGAAPAMSASVPAPALVSAATCLMRPVRCPFDWATKPHDHAVSAISSGGKIRIYQNLPEPVLKK